MSVEIYNVTRQHLDYVHDIIFSFLFRNKEVKDVKLAVYELLTFNIYVQSNKFRTKQYRLKDRIVLKFSRIGPGLFHLIEKI